MAGDRAAALRAEAAAVLVPLADLAAPVAPGAAPPWDQLIRVREHEVDRAASCGASLAFDRPFDGWRSAFARRRLGRAVLERMRRGAGLDPSALAGAVADDEADHGRGGLAQWLGELGPGGRAAVVRDATAFAIAARSALPVWPPRSTRFDCPAFAWDVPGRAVRLEAAADGEAWSDGGRGPARSLLLLATSSPSTDAVRRDISWVGLVATIAAGAVPLRITRIDLASGGRHTVPVTDDVLDDGLTAAAAAVEAAVAARLGAPSTPVPGRWCAGCDGRDVCEVAHRPAPLVAGP